MPKSVMTNVVAKANKAAEEGTARRGGRVVRALLSDELLGEAR
jgi:hypothetical protein